MAELLGQHRPARRRRPLVLAAAAAVFLTLGALGAALFLLRNQDKGVVQAPPVLWKASGPRRFVGHAEPVQGLGVSPDGRRVFSGSWDGTIRVWDVETGQQVQMVNLRSAVGESPFWVAFSRDARRALVASRTKGNVWLWDLETGRPLQSWKPPSPAAAVTAIVFSADGRQALFGCYDGTLRVWDVENWRELARAEHRGAIWGVDLSRDGRHALSAGKHNTLWDLTEGKVLRQLPDLTNGSWSAVFSPDDRRALCGGGDTEATMRLWDLETGRELRRLTGHTRAMKDAVFLSDGRHAVTASYDGTVRLWDLDEGNELHCFPADQDVLHSVVLSPDERYVVAAGVSGVVRLWPLPEVRSSGAENRP